MDPPVRIKPAYPYFGSKLRIAGELWQAFGDAPNYVEPFCGSAAVLLSRPVPGKIETLNDAHAVLVNFLRAVRSDPEAVADAATWPVSEIDMHARHTDLLRRADEEWRERMRADPRFFDAEMAGWWVWGMAIWIGSGWCDSGHRNAGALQRPALGSGHSVSQRKRPAIGGRGARPSGKRDGLHGVGINRDLPRKVPSLLSSGAGVNRHLPHLAGPNNAGKAKRQYRPGSGNLQLPSLAGCDGSGVGYGRGIFATGRREDLLGYFGALAERLARVRITCGDWTRVVTPAVTTSHGLTAVLLDPPYGALAKRTARLYAHDGGDVAVAAREWAVDHGDNPSFRIALCGYSEEHEGHVPASWRRLRWKARGGYGNQDCENANAERECVWLSPHCLGGDLVAGPLFEPR